MFARLVTVYIAKDKLDDAIALYRDSVMPAAQKEKGFKGGRLLINRATGKGLSVVIWESEAAANASGEGSSYFQEQIGKFSSMLTKPPEIETYEIPVFVG